MTVPNAIALLPLCLLLTAAPASRAIQLGDGSQQHTIQGEVVNSMSGQPVANALVDFGPRPMFTDHEGKFEVNVSAGSYVIPNVTKPGYFPQQQMAFVDTNLATPESRTITLKLDPEAVVSGTITDQQGQPLQGLAVNLMKLTTTNGMRRWQMVLPTTTSVEGEFRFAELQAGTYSLATGLKIDGLTSPTSAVAFVPVVYPVPSGNEQAGLTVAPGDHVEANLSPATEKLYEVTGRVEGAAGSGVNVNAETSSGAQLAPVFRFNQATGEFRLLLPSGSYRLKVNGYNQQQVQAQGTREISVSGAPLAGVMVSLAPLATIPVEVEYQDVIDSSGRVLPRPYMNVALESTDPRGPSNFFGTMASPLRRAEDPMSIRNLPPGQYRLQISPQLPWYTASAFCGGLDLTRELLSIAGSAAGCTLHVLLRNDSASVHWSVRQRGQAPPKSVYVYAVPLGNLAQSMSQATTNTGDASLIEGSLAGMAPGRYLVVAFDHDQQLAYKDPGMMLRYLSLGKEVTLTASGAAQVDLEVASGNP